MRLFTLLSGILLASQATVAQSPPAAILEITVENLTTYEDDGVEWSRLVSNPSRTTVNPVRNFVPFVAIGDVVSVNGNPARGTFTQRGQRFALTNAPTAGQSIADIPRGAMNDYFVEILHPDGRAIGTIVALGMGGAGAPPGAPLSSFALNYTVVGGTGAYLGVRGQWGIRQGGTPIRGASMSEDPANRRVHGGGTSPFVVHLIPMEYPTVLQVLHGDFSPVDAARPAAPGEIVVIRASGLGPTRPGVDPGHPFPAGSVEQVNSPVEALVNGRPATIANSIGWPGERNVYRVDVQVPDGIRGTASVQLSAGWITGPEARIPVQ